MDEFALVLNAGSSSLKFAVFRTAGSGDWPLAARGNIEGIGTEPKMSARDGAGSALPTPTLPADVRDAAVDRPRRRHRPASEKLCGEHRHKREADHHRHQHCD